MSRSTACSSSGNAKAMRTVTSKVKVARNAQNSDSCFEDDGIATDSLDTWPNISSEKGRFVSGDDWCWCESVGILHLWSRPLKVGTGAV